mgnify:CR=1 FL=1
MSPQPEWVAVAGVWDKPRLTPGQFRAQCRKWKREMGLDLVVLDYLQLTQADTRSNSREREVAEFSRAAKGIAGEFDLHMVILSQLNREAERAPKPLISHVRDSGAVEQDADNILLINPWQSNEGDEVIPVTVDLAKGRNSAVGSFELFYRRKFLRFVNPAQ